MFAALYLFAETTRTLGFVFCAFGTIFSMGILLSNYSLIWYCTVCSLFFFGGPIGVVANRRWGHRCVIVLSC